MAKVQISSNALNANINQMDDIDFSSSLDSVISTTNSVDIIHNVECTKDKTNGDKMW